MDRIRLNNVINRGYGPTEVPPAWPYSMPSFLSPVLPPPNMVLPYPMPGAQPMGPIPLFQNLSNNPGPLNSVSPNATPMVRGHRQPHAFQQKLHPIANHSNNKPNIQPLAQNITKNVRKPITDGNVTSVKILLNDNAASKNKSETEKTETKTSLVLHDSNSGSKNLGITSREAAGNGNEDKDSAQLTVKSTLIALSPLKFNELARLALRGSEIAEKLAFAHRNRPCFKKIDNLCARIKQDLFRPDGVLPNINSQGIAWAVKDFIFVFTRVINAWIIIKGYVHNTPEELNKIKQAFSPEFVASFAAWQDSTLLFIENLIKSFISLDNLVQAQKSVYQNPNPESTSCNSDVRCDFLPEDSDLTNSYILTMVEDSENSQRQADINGTYFKSGTYKPIKKEDIPLDNHATPSTSSSGCSSGSCRDSQTPISTKSMPSTKSSPHMSEGNSDLEHYNDIWPRSESNNKSELNILDAIKLNSAKYIDHWLSYDLRLLEEHQLQMEAQERDKNFISHLNTMIDRLMTMRNADLFFKLQFTKNYFPEFIAKYKSDFMDLRSIILKCQVGEYNNIYQVVHDIRKIIYAGKEFLKFNQDQKLCKSVKAFEAEFNIMLTQPPFNSYNFDHINGEPDESLSKY